MSTANGMVGTGRPAKQRYSLSRLGDLGLAFVWCFFACASTQATISDASSESWLNTAHHAVSTIVLWQFAILFVVRRPAKVRLDRWVPRLVAIVGSWAMPVVIWLPLTWTPDWLLVATTAGLVAAHLCLIWSLFTLRRSFSIFAEARALVRHGPYGIVRHPLYAVYMAMYVLLVLPRMSLLAVAVAAIGIGCEVWRARDEERVLAAAFGEYEEYAAATPRFVPRVRLVSQQVRRATMPALAGAEQPASTAHPVV